MRQNSAESGRFRPDSANLGRSCPKADQIRPVSVNIGRFLEALLRWSVIIPEARPERILGTRSGILPLIGPIAAFIAPVVVGSESNVAEVRDGIGRTRPRAMAGRRGCSCHLPDRPATHPTVRLARPPDRPSEHRPRPFDRPTDTARPTDRPPDHPTVRPAVRRPTVRPITDRPPGTPSDRASSGQLDRSIARPSARPTGPPRHMSTLRSA